MNDTENFLVFTYGTLKKGEPNHGILSDPEVGSSRFLGRATTVTKWPLVIASHFNIPFVLNSPGTGEHIVGEVYEVDKPMFEKLDELECYPALYDRTKLDVLLEYQKYELRKVKVWIYVLKDFKPEMINKPFIQEYFSDGSHHLPYAPQYNISPKEIFSEVKNYKRSKTLY